jgi:hypothetical protein
MVLFVDVATLPNTEAGSSELLRRARPLSAVLRGLRRPGVHTVEFIVSSPSCRCGLRVKWGTLALIQPHTVARRRAPPHIAARRRPLAAASLALHLGHRI